MYCTDSYTAIGDDGSVTLEFLHLMHTAIDEGCKSTARVGLCPGLNLDIATDLYLLDGFDLRLFDLGFFNLWLFDDLAESAELDRYKVVVLPAQAFIAAKNRLNYL